MEPNQQRTTGVNTASCKCVDQGEIGLVGKRARNHWEAGAADSSNSLQPNLYAERKWAQVVAIGMIMREGQIKIPQLTCVSSRRDQTYTVEGYKFHFSVYSSYLWEV